MKEIIFESFNSRLETWENSCSLKQIAGFSLDSRYNILIVSEDNKTMEYLDEWCNSKDVKYFRLDFNDIKFFVMNQFPSNGSNESVINRVRSEGINGEEVVMLYNPQEYQDYLDKNQNNYLMYVEGHDFKLNEQFSSLFNSDKVVLVLTGMENHSNGFDSIKRRKILDFIKKPLYDSLIFTVCKISKSSFNPLDIHNLIHTDGKDQFAIFDDLDKK